MVSRKEVVNRRKYLQEKAANRFKFKKGDRRVSTPRVCVVCGRPLSSLIINDNKYVVSQSHIRYYLNQYMKMDICEDVHSCYRTLKQKGELGDVDGG